MATATEAREHTDREYERELRELRHRLLLMAGQVEQMIAHATQALVERDVELAKATIEDDYKVNSAEMEIDELCIHILARRQPVASDLRFVTFALKMVTDLERTGDLAVTICKRAINLSALPQPKPYVDIPQMAGIAQEMVRGAIDAFVSADVGQAEQVIARDEEVDDLYDRVYDDLLPLMHENPSLIEACTRVQSVNKALERIGDHATNLAEQVIFLVKGSDIRHIGKRDGERNA